MNQSERPEPRPWSEIQNDGGAYTITPTWVEFGRALRAYDEQLYAKVDDDLWLEFEHYVHRCATGELIDDGSTTFGDIYDS